MIQAESVTSWLEQWRDGDPEAMDRVAALVYKDLRRLAAYHLKAESDAGPMQATALVHEVYLRLPSLRAVDWKGKRHFIGVVTRMMRQILVDHARSRKAAKRDPGLLEEPEPVDGERQLDTLAVDQALERMAARYPRCAQVVELRFFGDLDFSEIAEVMELSLATVERDWRFARAWLKKSISGGRG